MTPFVKKNEIKKDWYLIDAQNAAVGRLAAFISKVLRGKNKPTYNWEDITQRIFKLTAKY